MNRFIFLFLLVHSFAVETQILTNIVIDTSSAGSSKYSVQIKVGDAGLQTFSRDVPENSTFAYDTFQNSLPNCFMDTITNETEYINHTYPGVPVFNLQNHPDEYYSLWKHNADSAQPVYALHNLNKMPEWCLFGTATVGTSSHAWECAAVNPIYNSKEATCTIIGRTVTIKKAVLPSVANPGLITDAELPEATATFLMLVDAEASLTGLVEGTDDELIAIRDIAIHISSALGWEYARVFEELTMIWDDNDSRSRKNLQTVETLAVVLYVWVALLFIVTMFYFAWCCPLSNVSTESVCEWCFECDSCTSKCYPCGPDWMDLFFWALFWFLLLIIFSVVDNIVVSGLLLFFCSFCVTIAAMYYCCRWKCSACCNAMCGDTGCCQEGYCICCKPLNSNTKGKGDFQTQYAKATTVELSTMNGGKYNRRARAESKAHNYCFCNVSSGAPRRCPGCCKDATKSCEKNMKDCCFPLHSSPDEFSKGQCRVVICLSVMIIIVFIATAMVYVLWDMTYYKVLDREIRLPEEEYTPTHIAKFQSMLYARAGEFESKDWDNSLFQMGTAICGKHYDSTLTQSEKKESIYDGYIKKYDIDMSIFEKTEYHEFESVNEWFSRTLRLTRPGMRPVRPITAATDNNVIVSPADCRVVTFDDVHKDEKIWIKSHSFTVHKLLDLGNRGAYESCNECRQAFEGSNGPDTPEGGDEVVAQMGMFRLAPQDYHRYHSPVSGTIKLGFKTGDTLHSVSADAMTSQNLAILNKRFVLMIQPDGWADDEFLAYVIIGAVCVGSINLSVPSNTAHCARDMSGYAEGYESTDASFLDGCRIEKGEEIGTFKFGGSTIALVFPKDRIDWDQDLAYTALWPVEQRVNMGTQMATLRNP